MSEDIKFAMWGFGFCFAGFSLLIGWVYTIKAEMEKRVTYDWIEGKFSRDIKKEMDELTEVLKDIRDALVGDYDKKGLIARQQDLEDAIKELRGMVTCPANISQQGSTNANP